MKTRWMWALLLLPVGATCRANDSAVTGIAGRWRMIYLRPNFQATTRAEAEFVFRNDDPAQHFLRILP